MQSPSTVILVRYVSSFCGRTLQQMWPYVAHLCLSTCALWMKKHVSVPLMCLIPWKRHPNWFVKLVFQIFFVFSDLMRWQYLRTLPVVSVMTAPLKCLVEWDKRVGGWESCCAANAYPHLDGGLVGKVGIRDLVIMQLMMCAARTLIWC